MENEVMKIISTLNIILNNEIIGSCEIVIVRNKEDAEKEINECESTIKIYQKSLQDKNINSAQVDFINKKLFDEKIKKEEYSNYFLENF
jgi:hypothetical protein